MRETSMTSNPSPPRKEGRDTRMRETSLTSNLTPPGKKGDTSLTSSPSPLLYRREGKAQERLA